MIFENFKKNFLIKNLKGKTPKDLLMFEDPQ